PGKAQLAPAGGTISLEDTEFHRLIDPGSRSSTDNVTFCELVLGKSLIILDFNAHNIRKYRCADHYASAHTPPSSFGGIFQRGTPAALFFALNSEPCSTHHRNIQAPDDSPGVRNIASP
ncbi:MAG: hypothetical protein N0E55_15075, partial [Candidatus Thiodiazotropha taylori]|nr:hypothetical protein [Candidatus Thiodiazotropha taylori]MCW4254005.1 hypothetical protein [Candidatus Thiodiazotropha taylori]